MSDENKKMKGDEKEEKEETITELIFQEILEKES